MTNRQDGEIKRGPLGDARPDAGGSPAATEGSRPQEKVEDRPNVSEVTPEDYPEDQRAKMPRN